jgi:hypothetical protein
MISLEHKCAICNRDINKYNINWFTVSINNKIESVCQICLINYTPKLKYIVEYYLNDKLYFSIDVKYIPTIFNINIEKYYNDNYYKNNFNSLAYIYLNKIYGKNCPEKLNFVINLSLKEIKPKYYTCAVCGLPSDNYFYFSYKNNNLNLLCKKCNYEFVGVD